MLELCGDDGEGDLGRLRDGIGVTDRVAKEDRGVKGYQYHTVLLLLLVSLLQSCPGISSWPHRV